MSEADSKPDEVLASHQGLGRVYRCACGTIYVSVGPVELKFSAESFLQTFEMLRAAVDRLNSQSGESVLIEKTASLQN